MGPPPYQQPILRREEPPGESAWERGLRQAKEVCVLMVYLFSFNLCQNYKFFNCGGVVYNRHDVYQKVAWSIIK